MATKKLNLRTATIDQILTAMDKCEDKRPFNKADYEEDMKDYNRRLKDYRDAQKRGNDPYLWAPTEPMKEDYYEDDEGIYVETEGMPFCCGMELLGYFPEGKFNSEYAKLDAAREVKELSSKKCGMYIITLSEQQKGMIELLAELGWDVLAKFRNPNTNNTCFVYGLVKTPVRSKKA